MQSRFCLATPESEKDKNKPRTFSTTAANELVSSGDYDRKWDSQIMTQLQTTEFLVPSSANYPYAQTRSLSRILQWIKDKNL
mmetsp:Transcript_29154/g.113230  ORF Transcript_29154/g.113230 Transcript_29154/m.113230 type:complete len:82 (+) Transcript_29154:2058-2303(+)